MQNLQWKPLLQALIAPARHQCDSTREFEFNQRCGYAFGREAGPLRQNIDVGRIMTQRGQHSTA